MSEGYTREDEKRFMRRVAAFRGKFDLSSLSLPELIQRQKILAKKLVDEDFIPKNRRELLRVAKCAFTVELGQRFKELRVKPKARWED
ncbi:MAG: hypothetical protein GWN86_09650 [Desulfobacterales bacterium]|nr:hypothetical protein [Desulfobacterales bacterium]